MAPCLLPMLFDRSPIFLRCSLFVWTTLIFSLLLHGPAPVPEPDTIEVQLQGEKIDSFQSWLLRLDTNESFAFNEEGYLQLPPPAASKNFQIIDPHQKIRYFGDWREHRTREKIVIQVRDAVVQVHHVVSASRREQNTWEVAGQVEVTRPDEQPERATVQTSDWLKELAPVLLQKTNLGGGSPIIRGMSGNRILLMIDGFRLNNAGFRLGLNQYLNTVPAELLEQIEVINGPSGVQYGSDGLGGTVHLRTLDPASLDEPNLAYGGFLSTADGTHSQRLSGNYGSGPLSFQGHVNWNRYENLRAGDPVGEQNATGFQSWDASLNFTLELSRDRRLRVLNSQSYAAHVPRTDRILSGRDLLWEYHPQRFRLHGLRLEDRRQHGFFDYMDLGLGFMRQGEGTRRISSGAPDVLSEVYTDVDTWQVNGSFTKITHRVQWTYGFDFQADGLKSFGREQTDGVDQPAAGKFPDDSSYRSLGAFLVAEVPLSQTQILRLGLRQTNAELEGTLDAPIGPVHQDYAHLTPSLSWSYDRDNFFISASAGQGFRAPTLEDALSLGPSNQGFDAPNPNLDPEELWSYEITFRHRGERSLFQANLYRGRYTDLVEKVPGTYGGSDRFQGEPVFILDNVGQAEIDGVSLSFMNKIAPHQRLLMDASWTYGTQTDRGVPMGRIPPLRGNLSWLMERASWRLNGIFTWADRQDRLSPGDLDDSRIPEGGTPGYGVFHLRGRHTFNERLALNLALENAGDRLYKQHGSGIYEAGRRFVIELEAKWR